MGALSDCPVKPDYERLDLAGRYVAPATIPSAKCWQLTLPDDPQFLAAAYELLSRLGFEVVWETSDDTITDWECAALGSAIVLEECETLVPTPYAPNVFLWFNQFTPQGSAAEITTAINSSMWFFSLMQTLNVYALSEYTISVPLAAGDYTVTCYGHKFTSAGKYAWQLDNENVSDWQDWYAATPALATFEFDMTVEADGLHELSYYCGGKNASSSNMHLRLTAIEIKPA